MSEAIFRTIFGTASAQTGNGTLLGDLFDPATGKFKTGANGGTEALRIGAVLLQDGRAFFSGGEIPAGSCGFAFPLVSTANSNLFLTSTVKFSTTGSMSVSRFGHSATLLLNGEVLMAGGGHSIRLCRSLWPLPNVQPLVSAELYTPSTGSFSMTA